MVSAELRARIVSGAVLGLPVLAALVWGGWPFSLVVLAFALAAMREWMRLVRPHPPLLVRASGYGAMAGLFAAGALGGPPAALVAAVAGTGLLALAAADAGRRQALLMAAGLPYVGIGTLSVIWLRGDADQGLALALLLMLVVWTTDIAAYAVGRTVGGPKLWPAVSPGKTWSGAAGGLLAGTAAGLLTAALFGSPAGLPLWAAAASAAVLSVAAQAGDLFESALKRHYHVKDTGHLIPGHGGILDRVDGILAAAPLLALMVAVAEAARHRGG